MKRVEICEINENGTRKGEAFLSYEAALACLNSLRDAGFFRIEKPVLTLVSSEGQVIFDNWRLGLWCRLDGSLDVYRFHGADLPNTAEALAASWCEGFKWVQCYRDDLDVQDVAYGTDETEENLDQPHQVFVIAGEDSQYHIGEDGRSVLYSTELKKYWYKLVRKGVRL